MYNRFLYLIAVLTCFISGLKAQSDSTRTDSVNYYDMSIEQLLNIKAHGVPSELEKLINSLISVASKKPLNVRESPSIISLISADEIKNSGARDLIDVLRLVPGLDFGMDVEGVVGLGVRGNWAHEGKVLVLIDGQEINEILFATTQFGNHFPIDHIKKIEIIRGPGSAIYGGFAEYGVVNIITKQGEDLNGVALSGIYGQGENDFLRRNINLSIGKKIKDFEFSLSGLIGQGHRSDQDYTDIYDSTYNMGNGNSSLNPAFINLGMKYKGLSFRAMGDFFSTTVRDAYDQIKPEAYNESFNSLFSELKYDIKLNEKLTLTPKLNFKQQAPWNTPEIDSIDGEYNKVARRITGNLTASYNINRYINFVAGGEYYNDFAEDKVDTFYNGQSTISFYNYAFFAQGLIKTRFVNIIAGARYDMHNIYGDAFVPRVGLTKKYNRFHFKALYSNSFRAPSIENINLSRATGITPEKTQVIEVELGYQITRKSIFTVNFFDITTRNPIVYYYDDSLGIDTYLNSDASGTLGAELEYKIKGRWGYVGVNYAYYTASGKTNVVEFKSNQDSSLTSSSLLGFSNHRANLNASFNTIKGLSINPSVSFYGKRYGVATTDSLGSPEISEFDPLVLINLYINYNTPVKGLSVGVGVYDLLNQKFKFIQPYSNGYHAPLPGPAREFVFRLSYNLNFKKKSD